MSAEATPKKLEFDLFGELLEDSWRNEWKGMPEFVQEDLEPKFQILVSFEDEEDVKEFAAKIGQKITPNGDGKYTKSIWYPEAEIGRYADKLYVDEGLLL